MPLTSNSLARVWHMQMKSSTLLWSRNHAGTELGRCGPTWKTCNHVLLPSASERLGTRDRRSAVVFSWATPLGYQTSFPPSRCDFNRSVRQSPDHIRTRFRRCIFVLQRTSHASSLCPMACPRSRRQSPPSRPILCQLWYPIVICKLLVTQVHSLVFRHCTRVWSAA